MINPPDTGSDHRRSQQPAQPGLKVFVDPKRALTFGGEDELSAKRDTASNMKDDYKEYTKTCERIRQENAQLLDGFVTVLRNQRLATRTIRTHRENVDFFINEFLLYQEAKKPEEGIGEIDEFLGDWFIRKAMWSTPRTIKSTATSLYKFYGFLAASEKVTPAELAELKETVALQLPEWQAKCERYNDADIDNWRGTD